MIGIFLTVTIFKIRGLFKLITNVIGMVLEQLCTLLVEAVYLFFKIVNTLEVYIILLVDALTGKTSSNGKIAALAIGVLSVASFYTTFVQRFSNTKMKIFLFLMQTFSLF